MKQKMDFLSDLVTKTIDDGREMLVQPLMFYSKSLKRVITVPTGFVTDGASVPRLPVAYLACGGRAKRAACIHDFLYQTNGTRSRRQADVVFWEGMKVDGTPLYAREVMYAFVRLCGFSSWSDGPARYAAIQRLQNNQCAPGNIIP